MLEKFLEKAKRSEEKKVGMSLMVPASLKHDFDMLCKLNDVTVTSMLTTCMESLVQEAQAHQSLKVQYLESLSDGELDDSRTALEDVLEKLEDGRGIDESTDLKIQKYEVEYTQLMKIINDRKAKK